MKKIHHLAILLLLTTNTFGQSIATQPIIGWGTGAKGATLTKQIPIVNGTTGGILEENAGYAIGSKSKRHWSPQATGVAIGAGAGAAAGAIINKRNRVLGGVIGGVVGGAAGYAIGKRKDNKNKQEEAERVAAAEKVAAEKAAAEKAAAEKAAADRAAADEAERNKAVAQNTGIPTPTREKVVVREREVASVKAVATKPTSTTTEMIAASLTDAGKITAPFVLKTGFLPNDTYGDSSTPYPTSEYRRKSW